MSPQPFKGNLQSISQSINKLIFISPDLGEASGPVLWIGWWVISTFPCLHFVGPHLAARLFDFSLLVFQYNIDWFELYVFVLLILMLWLREMISNRKETSCLALVRSRFEAGCFRHTFTSRRNGPLARCVNCGLRMRREYRERFPRHHGLAFPTCITARASRTCRDARLDRLLVVYFDAGGGENVPGIPGACANRNFTYLVRDPCLLTNRLSHGGSSQKLIRDIPSPWWATHLAPLLKLVCPWLWWYTYSHMR